MWLAAGSIEIEGRTIHKDRPITAKILRDVAESYDPDLRQAPLLAAPQGASSSAHFSGRYGGPILGRIRSVGFDGIFAWVDFEPTEAYRETVGKNAGLYPSVSLQRNGELTGSPWYLEHVAALTGETPGTPNLDMMRSLNRSTRDAEASLCRTQITTTAEEMAVEETKETPEAAAEETKKKGEAVAEPEKATGEQPAETNAERSTDSRAEGITRAAKVVADAGSGDQMRRALEEITRTVQEQGKQLELMRRDAEKREQDAKAAEIRRSLDAAAGEGRFRGDVDKVSRALTKLDDEERSELLRAVTTPAPGLGDEFTIQGENGEVLEFNPNRYRTGDGAPRVSRWEQIEIEKVRRAATTDGKFDQQKFERGLVALRAQQIRKGVA